MIWISKVNYDVTIYFFRLNGQAIEERISKIELSSKVIDSADRLRDTLIHEMCHAAAWIKV